MSAKRKSLESKLLELAVEHELVFQTKSEFYIKVYAVEVAFNELFDADESFAREFYRFKNFIVPSIPTMDFDDYERFSPLIAFDRLHVLKKVDNKTLRVIRSTFVNSKGEYGSKLEEVLKSIDDENGFVDYPLAKNLFKKLKVIPNSFEQKERVARFDDEYTVEQLRKMGLLKIIEVFLKVVKSRNYFRKDRNHYKRKCLEAGI